MAFDEIFHIFRFILIEIYRLVVIDLLITNLVHLDKRRKVSQFLSKHIQLFSSAFVFFN